MSTDLRRAFAVLTRAAATLADAGPALAQAFRDAAKILAAASDQMAFGGLSADDIVRRIRGGQ